jgi:hypothetical protein
VTDKELKRLSKLELLELLLVETRENEKLREELAKAKKENSIEKSAVILQETAKQLDEALQKVSSMSNMPTDSVGTAKKSFTEHKLFSGKKPKLLDVFSKDIFKSTAKDRKHIKIKKKSKAK